MISVVIFSAVILSLAGLSFQVARRSVRSTDQALIIATSGLMVGEYAREAQELGARAFLPKPFTAVTLLTTLGTVLQGGGAS